MAQRMFSCKDEKHSLLATLWFNIAHYALRPWPWIFVALVSIVLYPNLQDKQTGYILVLLNYLPTGFKGLLLASFAAAYMSTVSAHLNWGSSYIVNDFYKRFIKKDASAKHYVRVARLTTVGLVVAGAIVTYQMETVAGAWKFLLALGAGTGAVYILRWFWWRINAWSEISAMIASFVISIFLQFGLGMNTTAPDVFAKVMLITVAGSSIIWLSVTYLTQPENEATLIHFYQKVHPGGKLWKPIAQKSGVEGDTGFGWIFIDWFIGIILIYCTLFGMGKILLGEIVIGIILLLIAAISFTYIMWDLNRRGWQALKLNNK